ncbi:hypothetical protein FVEG_12832 [Fusarium verticillioides 7600]|uniref:Uncharacterized protein n=1 Tax=Gibberella moniliformis (strain M3125 / FGSC 7600) TaxID=334819 RepID=W7N4W8_GIBM7|nr:hypothetical protein FVEG_12832 [Fusarium verticillioides 7600]EWG54684.1 hypothetical protein FVEG_12832 [Fusarium verticillioides 7600]
MDMGKRPHQAYAEDDVQGDENQIQIQIQIASFSLHHFSLRNQHRYLKPSPVLNPALLRYSPRKLNPTLDRDHKPQRRHFARYPLGQQCPSTLVT